jgi:hypothetical protein
VLGSGRRKRAARALAKKSAKRIALERSLLQELRRVRKLLEGESEPEEAYEDLFEDEDDEDLE